MRIIGRNGGIVAIAVVLGATVIGLIAGALVIPSGPPRPVAPPPVATIGITPAPEPTASGTAPPLPAPSATSLPTPTRRTVPHTRPARAVPADPDPVTVTTINSW